MIVLAILAILGALVLWFLGGRDSMTEDLEKKEDGLVKMTMLIMEMQQEKKELCRQVDYLSKRLFTETNGGILDIPNDENGEEE